MVSAVDHLVCMLKGQCSFLGDPCGPGRVLQIRGMTVIPLSCFSVPSTASSGVESSIELFVPAV